MSWHYMASTLAPGGQAYLVLPASLDRKNDESSKKASQSKSEVRWRNRNARDSHYVRSSKSKEVRVLMLIHRSNALDRAHVHKYVDVV